MKRIRHVITTLFWMGALQAKPLLPIEQDIVQQVGKEKTAQLQLLEKLVNINSGTTNPPGVMKVGKILAAQFKALGFKVRWVEEPPEMHRAPTLVATREGHAGKRLLLIGHLDTVFPKTSKFQKFKQAGNIATGPGVLDDKGGDVVILYALKALFAAHALDNTTIRVVLTGDEEDSGKPTSISRLPLFEAAKQSDIAFDFELAMSQNKATTGRRGIAMWRIEASGTTGHSSEIFRPTAGDGAIFELARILNTMRTSLKGEQYLSFNPGLILGGTTLKDDSRKAEGSAFGKENVIAQTALATGDLRFMTETQKQEAQKKIIAIVNDHLPRTRASITFQDGIPAMAPTEANRALLKQYSEVSEDLGQGVVSEVDPGIRGAGDISHIAALVSASLAGLGPVGDGAHSEEERVEMDTLPMQTTRAALLIYRLTR